MELHQSRLRRPEAYFIGPILECRALVMLVVNNPPNIPEIQAFLSLLNIDNTHIGANTAHGFTHATDAGNIS